MNVRDEDRGSVSKYGIVQYDLEGQQRCCTCKAYKPLSEYHKDKTTRYGVSVSCKECSNDRSKTLHKNRMLSDPTYALNKKNQYIKHKWGMSREEYDARLLAQDGKCAVCKQEQPTAYWHLDHNHKTGALRDFLCSNCNRGIGHLKEDLTILNNAIEYLTKHAERCSAEVSRR